MNYPTNKIIISKVIPTSSYLLKEDTLRPRDWNDVIQFTTQKLTNSTPHIQSIKHLFSPSNLFIYWAPVIFIYISALLNRRILYICWGMPKPSNHFINKLKFHKLKTILQRSDIVLVNDYKTFKEVSHIVKNKVIITPYIVDTDFFSLSPLKRENHIVVPGDNDRNELLVKELGTYGIKIYRITRTKAIADYHRYSSNVSIKYKIPYTELRELYNKATAVILPISSFNHPAGQTSVLEALSCGTPVIISKGRTSTIFKNNGMVQVCSSNIGRVWFDSIEQAKYIVQDTKLISKVRHDIERTNSFDSVCRFFLNTISNNINHFNPG